MGIFLGYLPIELKIVSNQVQIIPRYFPYDDNYFGKIYYKAHNLYLCLEIEDSRHKYVRHSKKHKCKFRKKIHTKFFGLKFWLITKSSLNQTFTYSISTIKSYINKNTGFKFKIRATYRYDSITRIKRPPYLKVYNKARTHVFSNELTLEK